MLSEGLSLWLFWVGATYLVGSIPFGLLLGFVRGIDIRSQGSGNVGATNVGRVLGAQLGSLCLVLDVAKGFCPVFGYTLIVSEDPLRNTAGTVLWLIVGVSVVFGHVFPIWLGFRGGKGVATGLGAVLGFWPVLSAAGLIAALLWLLLLAAGRYVSVASMVAACALPGLALLSGFYWQIEWAQRWVFVIVMLFLAVLIVARHRSNLSRLRRGTEPKITWGRQRS